MMRSGVGEISSSGQGVQAPHAVVDGRPLLVDAPTIGSTSAPPVFMPESFMDRINTTAVALGSLRKLYLRPIRGPFFVSPDLIAWFAPTTITLFLVLGTVYYTGSQQSYAGLFVLFTLLGLAFVSSFLVGVTDPGVYPRLGHGERDPLEQCSYLPLCKICNFRRPRRAAHCYTCGVCVLEHDHHCGVIGGCVGQRSLRWFTIYLLSISSASAMGVYWISMSLMYPPPDANRPTATELMRQRSRRQNQASLQTAAHIFLLIFIGNVALLVGGMALYYVYLMGTDTTRREAQGKMSKYPLSGSPDAHQHDGRGGGGFCWRWTHSIRGVFSTLRRTFVDVPQSMLVARPIGNPVVTVSTEDSNLLSAREE